MKDIVITMELRFEIPDRNLTLNGLIFGVKQRLSEIGRSILETLMTREIDNYKQEDEHRYIRNGHQHNSRQFRTSSIEPYKRYQREMMEAGIG